MSQVDAGLKELDEGKDKRLNVERSTSNDTSIRTSLSFAEINKISG